MASRIERRKLIKRKEQRGLPFGAPRKIRDGDRRRRGAIRADDAIRRKEMIRTLLGAPAEDAGNADEA